MQILLFSIQQRGEGRVFLHKFVHFYDFFHVRYLKMRQVGAIFVGKIVKDMETERIKSPERNNSPERIASAEKVTSPDGVRELMAELWSNHVCGNNVGGKCRVYMVDLPAPTEDELHDLAADRANRVSDVVDGEALENGVGKLGGW